MKEGKKMAEIRANKTASVMQKSTSQIGNGQFYDPKNYRFGCFNRGFLVGFPKREGNKIVVSRTANESGASFALDVAEGLVFDEVAAQSMLHEIVFQVSGAPNSKGGYEAKAVVTEVKPVDAHVIRKGNNIFDIFSLNDDGTSLKILPRAELRQTQLDGLVHNIAAYNVVRFSGICTSIEMKNAAEVSGIDDTGAKEEPYLEMRIRQTSDSNECIPVRLYGNVAAHQAVLERAVMRPFSVFGLLQFSKQPMYSNDGNPLLDAEGNPVIAKENFIRLRKMPQTPTAMDIVWLAEESKVSVPTWVCEIWQEHRARMEEKAKARAAAQGQPQNSDMNM